MRIKKLEIFGFKSFADRIVIDFDSGVTGIVGPNGCGKSNIVDALRWVMGEQSAKHLRGGNMQDVIFSGSQKRGPLGMAEVMLTLENSGDNPTSEYGGYQEIEIARRLYKTGDSEYEINKRPCRLKDITELFLGTGVGTKAYSIIEQGRVSSIIQSKPEDRRQIIEEAAGITKYKARRLAAERRMEATQQNLLRISDILREVENRLQSLEHQAKKAEKYHLVQGEIKEIELHHAALKFLELNNKALLLKNELENKQQQTGEFEERIEEYETLIERQRDALSEDEKELNLKQKLLYEAENVIALSKQDIAFSTTSLEQKNKQTVFINQETRRLEEKIAQLLKDQDLHAEEKLQVDSEVKALEAKLQELSSNFEAVRSEQQEKQKLVESARSQFMHSASTAAKSQAEILALKQKQERGRENETRLQELINQKETESAEKQIGLSAKKIDLTKWAQAKDDLAHEIQSLRTNQEEMSAKQDLLEKKRQLLNSDLANKQGRLNSLQEIEESMEFAGEGVSRVMKDPDHKTVLGLVANFVHVPNEIEDLVDLALKHHLEAILLENPDELESIVSSLSQQKDGRIRFFVENWLKPMTLFPQVDEAALPEGAYTLLSKVDVFKHKVALKHLLGSIVVMPDSASAYSFWPKAQQQKLTLITPDCSVFEPNGCLTGGIQTEGQGVIKRKNEIKSLGGYLSSLTQENEDNEEAMGRQKSLLAQLKTEAEAVKDKSHALSIKIAKQEQDIQSETRAIEQARSDIQALEQDAQNNQLALKQAMQDLFEYERTLSDAQKEHEKLEALLLEEGVALKDLEAIVEDKNNQVTALKVQIASLKEKQNHFERHYNQTKELAEESTRQIETLNSQLTQTVQDQSSLVTQKEAAEEKIATAQTEHSELSETLRHKREQYEQQLGHVKEKEATVNAERKQVEVVRNELVELKLKLQESSLSLESLDERLHDRYRLKAAQVLTDYHHLPMPGFSIPRKVKELQRQIDQMGNINPNAMEEFEDLKKRHDFLKTQNDDLSTALLQLEEAIKRINETTLQRFSQAFHTINERFSQVFPRLFKGGKGWLELTNPQDMLTTGVEIFAQPPGKKLSSISVLSGGEKALTATSLVFAIFLIKPSPFCLLDEVDAPLDEANVDRFGAMVKELSKVSQFIVITHNKRTMEITDQLYGITMEQPGISKTVHVKVAQHVKAEEPAAVPLPEASEPEAELELSLDEIPEPA